MISQDNTSVGDDRNSLLLSNGLEIARNSVLGLVYLGESVPFVAPFASVLQLIITALENMLKSDNAAKTLMEKVMYVATFVDVNLWKYPDAETQHVFFHKPLTELTEKLQEIEQFLQEYAKNKSSITGLFKRGTGKTTATIEDYSNQLQEHVSNLKLSISAAQFSVSKLSYNKLCDIENLLKKYGGFNAVTSDDSKFQQFARESDSMHIPVNKASTYKKELLLKDEAKVLGEGGFGKVFGGTYNGEPVAIKTLRRTNSSTIHELKNEVRMLQILGSFPGIVRLVTANINNIDKDDELCLVMEVAKGTLHDVLYNNLLGPSKQLSLSKKLSFVSQIAAAMNMLFTFQVLYRDLKPANVLIFLFGNQPIAKLTDFGLAKRVGDQSSAMHLKGTIAYIAPELFSVGSNGLIPYSFPAEVYSFGILLNEVMTNSLPYPSELLNSPPLFAIQLEKGLLPTIYAEKKDSLSIGIAVLIEECIQRNSSLRPSFALIVERINTLLSSSTEIIVATPASPSTTTRMISLYTWDEAISWTFLVQNGCSVNNTKPFVPVTGELLESVQKLTDLEEHGIKLGTKLQQIALQKKLQSFVKEGVPEEIMQSLRNVSLTNITPPASSSSVTTTTTPPETVPVDTVLSTLGSSSVSPTTTTTVHLSSPPSLPAQSTPSSGHPPTVTCTTVSEEDLLREKAKLMNDLLKIKYVFLYIMETITDAYSFSPFYGVVGAKYPLGVSIQLTQEWNTVAQSMIQRKTPFHDFIAAVDRAVVFEQVNVLARLLDYEKVPPLVRYQYHEHVNTVRSYDEKWTRLQEGPFIISQKDWQPLVQICTNAGKSISKLILAMQEFRVTYGVPHTRSHVSLREEEIAEYEKSVGIVSSGL